MLAFTSSTYTAGWCPDPCATSVPCSCEDYYCQEGCKAGYAACMPGCADQQCLETCADAGVMCLEGCAHSLARVCSCFVAAYMPALHTVLCQLRGTAHLEPASTHSKYSARIPFAGAPRFSARPIVWTQLQRAAAPAPWSRRALQTAPPSRPPVHQDVPAAWAATPSTALSTAPLRPSWHAASPTSTSGNAVEGGLGWAGGGQNADLASPGCPTT